MRGMSALLIANVLAFPAWAHAADPVQYSVAVAVSHDGQEIGRPALTVLPGHTARIESSDKYRVDATLSQASAGKLKLQTTVWGPGEGGWIVVSRPTLTLAEGGQAAVRMSGGEWGVAVDVKPK
jgi:hypothetical protein